jgi:hypothetical protein
MRHLNFGPQVLHYLCTLLLLVSISASATDTRELQERRQRAAAAFPGGILLVHARSAVDTTADGFLQDPVFYYFTGLENVVGGILSIDSRLHQSWLSSPPNLYWVPRKGRQLRIRSSGRASNMAPIGWN